MPDYSPARKEFDRLRSEFSVVPVWREVLADFETPVSAYSKLADEGPSFLLESVEHGERWGRYSFLGFDPFLVISKPAGTNDQDAGENPLEKLRAELSRFTAPRLPGLPPFFGGAVGYIGYDCVRYLEQIPQSASDDVGAPELLFMFPRTVMAFDHLRQKITAVSNVLSDDSYESAVERTEALVAKLGQPLAYSPMDVDSPTVSTPPESTMTMADFEKGVHRAKEYIAAGDIFQVVLSHRISTPLEAGPFSVYRGLRLVNPSPYMFFLSHPEITLIGSSPEPLVTVHGRRVTQRPIAGTRPRGATPEEDAENEASLLADEKERAEHVMLVDLARNDLGRVSHWGSVKVEELMSVERYSHVMHLVSQVSGELAVGKTGMDALFASFPAGTVSGAPKIRAMEIIDELELTKRGPYAGVVGYIDFSGDLDTCITLRTAYVSGGNLHTQAGAGIVADSDPATEWDETMNKARALLAAAQIARGIR